MIWGISILYVFLLVGKQSVSPDILRITVPEIVVNAGESSVIIMEVEIKNGYHIQANKVNDDLLIPTTLEISKDKSITTGSQEFPPAKKFMLAGADKLLDVYDGNFEIRIPFKTIKNISKGKHRLDGKLHYQACDHRTCLFPKTIGFSITVKVA